MLHNTEPAEGWPVRIEKGVMGMEKQFDIIGVCDPVMDMAVSIGHIPATDSLERMNDMLWQSGGNGASAITGAARLGAKCGIIGATGTDAFGDFCYNDMVYHGVDTKYLYRMPGATPFCICLAETETQGRSFIATNTDMGAVQEDQIDEDYVASAKIIHTDLGDFPGKWKAIEYAKKHGVLVSTDAGYYDPSNCDRMIDTADILIMSSMFYKGVFGDDENYVENCRSLLSRGPKIVIVTLGSKGCAGTDGTTDFTLPPFSGYEIIDTTGAGDIFHGAYCYAYLQGWDIVQCARFSSAVSYINSLSLGGRAGQPTRDMVDTFLETGKVDLSVLDERKRHYRDILQFKGV